MGRKHIRFRWMSLPMGVFGIIFALIFGAIAVIGLKHPEDNPTVRLAIPLYLFSVYWAIAALCNVRSAVLTPAGVWSIIWPFPVTFPRLTRRAAIRHCFLRRIDIYDEGTELEHYFMAGVETIDERQIDLSGPHMTEEPAIQSAREIVDTLNQDPALPPLPIQWVEQTPPRRQILARLLLILFWSVVAGYTLYLGIQWEEAYQRDRRSHAISS